MQMRQSGCVKSWRVENNQEWSELKIKENEYRITELNAKMKKTGELFDALYQKKIDNLEKENSTWRQGWKVFIIARELGNIQEKIIDTWRSYGSGMPLSM